MAPLNEPSMEDILASIRRIIAEDQSQGLSRGGLTGLTRRTQVVEPSAPVVADQAVTEAVETVHSTEEPRQALPIEEPELHAAPQGDILRDSYDDQAHAPEALAPEPIDTFEPEHAALHHPASDPHDLTDVLQSPPEMHAGTFVTPHEIETEPLVSSSAGASITSSFQALAESVVLQDPGLVERIMRETMRPLLKDWLDDHLPSIVERLVRVEIERVARGGRGRD
jgi:uncharacterized protein